MASKPGAVSPIVNRPPFVMPRRERDNKNVMWFGVSGLDAKMLFSSGYPRLVVFPIAMEMCEISKLQAC